MNILGLEIGWARKSTSLDIDAVMRRFDAVYALASGIAVTPDLAMRSPTVRAIVEAVSRRIASLPIQVLKKSVVNGRTIKEPQPDHPITRVLAKPNRISDPSKFWLDATSWLIRYGNFYAVTAKGNSGPVRRLHPIPSYSVNIRREPSDVEAITYQVTYADGRYVEYQPEQILHARGSARDGIKGDSIVLDVAEAIALEIAAEKFGASFFGNGAMPGLIFKYSMGSQGFKTDEEVNRFIDDIQKVFAKKDRFKSLFVPKGVELGDPIAIDNDKAQFLGLRQYQRTVIAGAFGVPPHLVGDLSKGTFNNVEQQTLAFVTNVVQPFCKIFEDAMEQSLLTDAERAEGIIIRFNIDAALRADFKTRQEGLAIQRQNGALSPNEWREMEGRNPRKGGDTYLDGGTSGQKPAGSEPEPTKPEPIEDEDDDTEDDEDAEND